MRYFYDTEFHERGPGYPIELISIGVVSENDQELYLINTDFDWHDSKHDGSPSIKWLRKHAMPHVIGRELDLFGVPYSEFRNLLLRFIQCPAELWSYNCAYDHVLLSQIFGTMRNLPKSWRYTMDLKQLILDRGLTKNELPSFDASQGEVRHRAIDDARWMKRVWEQLHPEYNHPLTTTARAVLRKSLNEK